MALVDPAADSVWYVIKQPQGTCEILNQSPRDPQPESEQVWGPYESREEAIARRVGLIRSGKCLPV